MTINAAAGQSQLYQLLYGQNGTSASGTAASGSTTGTAGAGQDVSSLLQELLGDAAGSSQGTSTAATPVSNNNASSQLASNTLASLLGAQSGASDPSAAAGGAGDSFTGAALTQALSGQQWQPLSTIGVTLSDASISAGETPEAAAPGRAQGGAGGSVSSILSNLLAQSEAALLGGTSSVGTTSLSASTVTVNVPGSGASSSSSSASTAGSAPTASVAAQALNQLADLLQNLAAQLATSQYANANQLTNPTAVGATVSSVA